MKPLARLQQEFQHYVYHRDGRMLELIVGNAQVSAPERLEIYAGAYRLRLLEVLGNEFKGLIALAGAESFEKMGRAYINAYPSTHYNVRWYGDHLATFLSEAAPWNTQPALAEMATLDWAISTAFDADDEPTIALDAVAATPPPAWPGMVPVLQSATQCLQQHWNVTDIRKAADHNNTPPALTALDATENCLVWRKNMEVLYRPLNADEAAALTACTSGACFAELCESLLDWHEEADVALRAAALLRRWVDDGLVCEIRLPPRA